MLLIRLPLKRPSQVPPTNLKVQVVKSINHIWQQLSSKFGKDFDKYLLRELIEQIDLKDPVKAQKDKNEPFKVQLLTQEFNRCIQKPEFLTYFGEVSYLKFVNMLLQPRQLNNPASLISDNHYYIQIVTHTFNDRISDFFTELTRRLKPASFTSQLILALSLVESCKEEVQSEGKRETS